jgi:hypothetical protein
MNFFDRVLLSGVIVLAIGAARADWPMPGEHLPHPRLNAPSQLLTGGVILKPANLGTMSSGTITIDCGKNPEQFLIDGGAFTLAAPKNDSSCLVLVRNNGSAGAITFSGFNVGSATGDALDTTNAHLFTLSIWRITDLTGPVIGYRVAAHQ